MNSDDHYVSKLIKIILFIGLMNIILLSTNFEYKFMFMWISIVFILIYLLFNTLYPWYVSWKKVYRNNEE